MDEKLIDVRVVDRNMEGGKVNRKEYQKWLDSLEDDADLAVPSEVQFIRGSRETATSTDSDED